MLYNLLIECQVMRACHGFGARKLMYFASSCSYPRACPQPMRIESLMCGPLESTNEAYATAKIAGIKLCQAYRRQYGTDMISVIPANTYGPGDSFSIEDSHVIAGLMTKMHRAKSPAPTSWKCGVRDYRVANSFSPMMLPMRRFCSCENIAARRPLISAMGQRCRSEKSPKRFSKLSVIREC